MAKHSIELAAPAGNFESLHAAIKGGCDAVYFGVTHLNMRAGNSCSFPLADIAQVVKLCRKNNIRCYSALNTILYDRDLKLAYQIMDTLKREGVDSVILTDAAAFPYARQLGLPVHISTQVSISNIQAVKFYSAYAQRMVLARELNLGQIKAISQEIREQGIKGPGGTLVEIEIFAHGAMCIAISGKCWMSLYQYNASANRGECRQVCRRGYLATDMETGKQVSIDHQYLLSPRDICTLPFLDKVAASGIKALKIEGRARSPEYVYTVTKAYRRALTAVARGSFNAKLAGSLLKQLKTVYNRGFSAGYYLGHSAEFWSKLYGSHATHRKIFLGKITNYFSKQQAAELVLQTGYLNTSEQVIISGPTTGLVLFKLKEMRKNNKRLKRAVKGETISLKTNTAVRRADRLYVLRKQD